MEHITFKFLQDNNFEYKGLSNRPIKDICIKCNKIFEYTKLKKFIRNRVNISKKAWCQCQKCFLQYRTIDNPDWIEKNRQSQLIAQNKEEQKKKNAEAVSKSWTKTRKDKASQYLKERWANDEAFKNKAMINLSNHRKCNFTNGIASGGLRGLYNDIYYDSALELSFILWCENNNISIRRYDKDSIRYMDEHGIERQYFPDFIINNTTIVEIKGKGIWYNKHFERNQLKMIAAKTKLNAKYCVYYDLDEQTKLFYRKARKLHHENKKKNTTII